ncbi:MAG TPA: aldehyde dehydrogenase family protein [Candidatus Saccharimonadales bacterium]|nr:aldehyde dehydrogenase family protein [Candidatus Saccharimonadales bacterium]
MQTRNFIDGQWADSHAGRTFENRNPARHDEVIGRWPASDAGDVARAVAAAARAFRSWRLVPAPKRGELLFQVGRLLAERKEEIARVMTREMGKVLPEARGDVQEGIDTAFYAAGEGRRLFGQTVQPELPNKAGYSLRQPIGVAGLITPWNFPLAIATWKMFPALVCGNTVLLKPASDVPASATLLFEVLEAAGLPPGVVNLVHGSGSQVGDPMVAHPDIKVLSFTGSTEVGKRIAQQCGGTLKRCSLELGGKNAQIVLDDADLDLALEGALWGAFGTTGQRCTATSRLILHRKIAAEFTERLVARARALRLGDGLEAGVDVGPVVNAGRIPAIAEYVEIGQREGARLVLGGGAARDGELARGHFFQPTVFDRVTPGMRIAQEEIFGPVVALLTCGSADEAVEILNGTLYGLSSSIYTRDLNRAQKAIRDIEAGIVYVNGPTIGAEVHLPFGGVKETGNGHREAGTAALDVFSEWKTVYIDYSGKLQKAQIDS